MKMKECSLRRRGVNNKNHLTTFNVSVIVWKQASWWRGWQRTLHIITLSVPFDRNSALARCINSESNNNKAKVLQVIPIRPHYVRQDMLNTCTVTVLGGRKGIENNGVCKSKKRAENGIRENVDILSIVASEKWHPNHCKWDNVCVIDSKPTSCGLSADIQVSGTPRAPAGYWIWLSSRNVALCGLNDIWTDRLP